MDEKYNALFTPWKIGNVEIPNRIVQCSMGGTSLFGWLEPNHFDKEAAYFLLNRAQDGVGLILPGASAPAAIFHSQPTLPDGGMRIKTATVGALSVLVVGIPVFLLVNLLVH